MSTKTIREIIKRNGQRVPFEKTRILKAVEKAFLSENISDIPTVATLTDQVVNEITNRLGTTELTQVEVVQDVVEEVLMKNGHHRVAKNFILYREKQKMKREIEILTQVADHTLEIQLDESHKDLFDPEIIRQRLDVIAPDLKEVDCDEIINQVTRQIYQGISKKDIDLLVLGAARERIERHYDYSSLASRLLVNGMYKTILNSSMNADNLEDSYKTQFADYIKTGVSLEMLNPVLAEYDISKVAAALEPSRDKLFHYLGIQILSDRYLLRDRTDTRHIFELPQWFWMRVAMGLAIQEENREDRAIEFYNTLSKLDLVSSTPTLFNSGTCHSQMSSCYINITDDSLSGIFKLYQDNAMLSKWAGGIGTDWTPVRATGSRIKGTNGTSQGVIPFIKIFNDVALAVNQGGKRKGAMCAYMEVWHLDFEQFLELKKNTGDERRRAHDINTAAWIPDLFMKRVKSGENWTLFCPSEVPELHDLYGKEFEARYVEYEKQNLSRAKTIQASDMWRKMLTMLYETGHPWITFKDPINLRSPQDHVGVVHSSNLCTEITLNTSKEETAVCNLASINLAQMITPEGELDEEKIKRTIHTGIRMLDNVIDNNYYPTAEAKRANMRHRAIGLGVMGYQDALYQLDLKFDCNESLEFADKSMEMISYYAIDASSALAKERGAYETYEGSKWSRGIFPYDSLAILEENRGEKLKVDKAIRLDWDSLKQKVKQQGMRNSNTMAIAPTATIANIAGVYPCTEPIFKNIYMKENLSGNFLVINRYLIDDLKSSGLWNQDIINKAKVNNGSLQDIIEIPQNIRDKYKEVFEIESEWVVKKAALRAKWIDQSASTNVFISTTSGKVLYDVYFLAWEYGLKTTYYLRTLGASQVQKMSVSETASSEPENKEEKMTVNANSDTRIASSASTEIPVCLLNDPGCEACQ
ncbi:MAG: ribonucleoside-diphosphate reductase subunit alpha [bacterium]|nr:ribonucleoside-diphosphate reductase subunit alpha [bacterium]